MYKFYLKTTGDETDPRFCGKPKTCFHVKSKKNGFCSNKGSYNCNKKQEDNKECNEKNSKRQMERSKCFDLTLCYILKIYECLQ